MHRARDMIASAIRGARHYSDRLGKEPEQKSRGWGAFRQVRRLAECQKSAEGKHQFPPPPPPPPANRIGGGGQISREKRGFLAIEAVIWRRGGAWFDFYPRESRSASPGAYATRLALPRQKMGKLAEWLKIFRKSRTGLADGLSSKLPSKIRVLRAGRSGN